MSTRTHANFVVYDAVTSLSSKKQQKTITTHSIVRDCCLPVFAFEG